MNIRIACLLISCLCAATALGDDLADILTAADNDNVEAQMVLGGMYEIGVGVARNEAKCAYWWQRASDNGHVNATKALGSMYFSGRGVAQDYEKAMALYLKAAELGHPHAIKYVALGYKRGLGLPQDDAKAAEWADKATALGGPDSAVVFLESYAAEETEVRTDEEIFAEFLKQAEKGNPRAFFYVGAAYLSGIGTPQNYQQAIDWMRRAAEQNLSSGMSDLGLLLQLGQGTPVDRVEAQKLHYLVEARRPNEKAFLTEINAKYMTAEELAEARRRVDAAGNSNDRS
jgi:TPR repeat protein